MPLAEILVTLKPSLFDAQGETIKKALHQLGHSSVKNARIGKYITLEIEGADSATFQSELDLMCQQLLANPVIENYEITVGGTAVGGTSRPGPSDGVTILTSRAPGGAGVAASVSPGAEPVTTSGGIGIGDPFTVDFASYEGMTTEAKLALRALALQKHRAWIEKELKARHAAWILCVGQEVVESGESLDSYPTEARLQRLGEDLNLVPWVFTRPNA